MDFHSRGTAVTLSFTVTKVFYRSNGQLTPSNDEGSHFTIFDGCYELWDARHQSRFKGCLPFPWTESITYLAKCTRMDDKRGAFYRIQSLLATQRSSLTERNIIALFQESFAKVGMPSDNAKKMFYAPQYSFIVSNDPVWIIASRKSRYERAPLAMNQFSQDGKFWCKWCGEVREAQVGEEAVLLL